MKKFKEFKDLDFIYYYLSPSSTQDNTLFMVIENRLKRYYFSASFLQQTNTRNKENVLCYHIIKSYES